MNGFSKILKLNNFINNKWEDQGNGEWLEVVNKYDQKLIGRVPMASSEQMNAAIEGAETAFEELKTWSAGKRAAHLTKLCELLAEEQQAFANLIVAEAGKPLSYARTEINRCQTTLETAAREALNFSGEIVPMDFNGGEGKTAFTKRFPLGPIACISPFNFPLNLALHKIAPALATGNTIVLKPAPQSPLTALAFAALVEKAGFPAGSVSVLVADIPEAQQLVTDPRMKMLSFTGSPQVGWYLKNIVGEKKVALELGGNAAVIIDAETDLVAAARTVAIGSFLYAGQICISTQRIYILEKYFSAFIPLLLEEINRLHVGDPGRDDVIVGPIIDSTHLKRISSWVDEAVEAGAHVLAGGKVISEANNLYAPTLITNTEPDMKVVAEEVFGPVAIIEKVKDFDAAIAAVNDSKFGLQAGVFTNSLSNMKKAFDQLEVGGVIINNVPGYRMDPMPYGGIKQSGLGREGLKYAMEEMTEPRLIVY
jgi:glyceraldehyde-3-phosphate dehydrogenase (NADP+)